MSSRADHHVEYHALYNIINASLRSYPFPHFYVEGVFPDEFYREMMASFPDPDRLQPIAGQRGLPAGTYPSRFMLLLDPDKLTVIPDPQRRVWERLRTFLLGQQFAETLMWKFRDTVNARLAGQADVRLRSEAMLVDDRENYVLGPHTDNPKKLITLLFYLPQTAEHPELGTSIYVPNDPAFRCPGGPEYPADRFQRVHTMPYRPNSLFAFVKTENSFHGVEPVTALETRRQLLLFDIYLEPAAKRETASSPSSGAKFAL